jgi:Uma2 family endonuclease
MSAAATTSALSPAPPFAPGPGAAVALPIDPTAIRPGQRFVLYGVDWRTYMAISDAAGNRRLHIAYDQGVMELMPISMPHGRFTALLSRMIVTLSEEMGRPIMGCGTFTLNREDLAKGIEPDEVFYLENAARINPAEAIDLRRDPPPDLAVEVDITSSSVNRLGIYEAIGVAEVWRFDETKVECRRRQADGKYHVVEVSGHFPGLRTNDLLPFVEKSNVIRDDNAFFREFRTWVREQLAQNWAAPGSSPS